MESLTAPVWFCPACESDPTHHHFFERVIGKLWNGGQAPVPVFYAICDVCGQVFQWQRMSESDAYQYYTAQYRATIQGGNDGVTDRVLAEQKKRTDLLMPELPFEDVKYLLDIGSSTGLFMAAMKEKYNCDAVGIEPGEKFRLYAMKQGHKSLSDLDILHAEHDKAFDLITIIHTLEHLTEPAKTLVRIHDYIAEGGRLLIEVPHMHHEYSLSLPHVTAFTPETLTALLGSTGWKVEWLKEYDGMKIGRPHPSNILVCAVPGEIDSHRVYVDIDAIHSAYLEGQKELHDYELQWQAAAQTNKG